MTVALAISLGAAPPSVRDEPFLQEYRTEYAYPEAARSPEVRALAATRDGELWLASRAGVFRHADERWQQVVSGSSYALAARGSEVWAGAWNGLYRISGGVARKEASVEGPIVAVFADAAGVVALSQTGLFESDGAAWKRTEWKGSRAVRSLVRLSNRDLWVATGMGLYRRSRGVWSEYHAENELLSGEVRALAAAPDGAVWAGSNAGVDVYRDGRRSEWFNTARGMPNQNVRSLAIGPGGEVWMGTSLGVVRLAAGKWSLRHSRRWLPSDDVLALAAAPDSSVWVATAEGLSRFQRRAMTLEEKARHFLDICLARHVRPPGLVEKCELKSPGDTSVFSPVDDDNDGQYTGMYLAMESYRYAVTKEPAARENAKRAFHALRFLQEVTGTSGFFARTVVPSTWTKVHDPNEALTAEEAADRFVRDPRSKPVERRWRPSADGQWLWKGDTSSDEVTGHLYGYFIYYELAADADERAAIEQHVRRIVDHLVANGDTLQDIDGRPTRWGVWSPKKLNADPDWRAERWTNALEILSYLQCAYWMTHDEKYRRHYIQLIEEHHYDRLARRPLATEPSEATHFDHELLALVLPAVMTENDPLYRAIYDEALAFWLPRIREQSSPFFSFQWAAMARARSGGEFGLDRSLEFLRDAPLDLVEWSVDNRQREDIRFVHQPDLDEIQTDRVLPPSERALMRWDGNPWRASGGEGGNTESSGVYWLLPYWMGRYYGFIEGTRGDDLLRRSGARARSRPWRGQTPAFRCRAASAPPG